MSELVQPWPTTLMGLLGRSMHKRPQMQPAPCQCDKMRPGNIQNKIPAHPDSHFLSKVVSFIDDSLCLASLPVSHFAIHSQVLLDAMARRRLINLHRVVYKAETKSSGDRTGRQQPIDPLLKAKRMRFHFIALCKNHLILDPNSRPCLESRASQLNYLFSISWLLLCRSLLRTCVALLAVHMIELHSSSEIESKPVSLPLTSTNQHLSTTSSGSTTKERRLQLQLNPLLVFGCNLPAQLEAAAALTWCSMEMELDFVGEKTGENR